MSAIPDDPQSADATHRPCGVEQSAFSIFGRIVGAALVASALGLWVLPGSDYSAELLLIKLGLTLTMALIGVTLYVAARR